MGRDMRKDEIIQLHMFLLQLRTRLENMVENDNSQAFLLYDEMNLFPQQVHRTKDEHELAVFELSKGIADLLQGNNSSTFQNTYDSLEGMCDRLRTRRDKKSNQDESEENKNG